MLSVFGGGGKTERERERHVLSVFGGGGKTERERHVERYVLSVFGEGGKEIDTHRRYLLSVFGGGGEEIGEGTCTVCLRKGKVGRYISLSEEGGKREIERFVKNVFYHLKKEEGTTTGN